MKRTLNWRAVLFVLLATLGCGASAAAQASDAAAVEAYRAGDLASARTLWLELLEVQPPVVEGAERARVLYNLGNLAVREQRDLEAVGWYTAALRLRPRDADTWANLEFARLTGGLEPADRGDLAATVSRLLGALAREEAVLLALLALVPLALCLALEALRGGRAVRIASALALCLALLGLAPLAHSWTTKLADPQLIVEAKGAAARSEPRTDAERIETLSSGESFERVGEYPGWVQLRLAGGRRGWVRAESVFALDR
jgi:tetratricopeptide (TPR) repeat protein